MTRSLELQASRAHALPRWITLAAGFVLVLGFLAGVVHHHDLDETAQHQHPCVVCVLHHAPATPVAVVEPVPPAPSFERVAVADVATPRPVTAASGPTRGPPTA